MRTLNQLLEETALRYPDRIAVVDPNRETKVTFKELNDLCTGVSTLLRSAGVSPGDRVGICARKSIGTVACLLGVMKAGAAYVPVDAAAPGKRKAYIFQDCGVKAIILERSLLEDLRAAFEYQTLGLPISLDTLKELASDLVLVGVEHSKESHLPAEVSPDLSYILYTSGSTGRPKGVIHTHASALSFVDWCSDIFQPSPNDCFSSHAPFHFDLSILDIYVPLKHGSTLVLIGEELGKHPAKLAEAIANRKITVWYSTPSILRLLLQYGRLGELDFSALRLVLFAGEVFPIKYLREVKTMWPRPVFFNLYGPTETNVCTYYQIPQEIPAERTEPFPIGYTCSNDRSRVVDENGADVSGGEEGELFVSGGSVMKGYWNLPDRTAQAFHTDQQGTRWYRTGDVVREEADGLYEFVGRRDRMVKRRGYRVELGEIEAALYQHPAVSEAAVVALPHEMDSVRIRAFLAWSAESRPSLIEIKKFCSENLPLYMIPDQFSFESSLPKTSTDKVDYQKLIELSMQV